MDSHQQQFCLKWNSFGSNLATAFSNLFKSESLTDVTLFCEETCTVFLQANEKYKKQATSHRYESCRQLRKKICNKLYRPKIDVDEQNKRLKLELNDNKTLKEAIDVEREKCASASESVIEKEILSLPPIQQESVRACFAAAKLKNSKSRRYTIEWVYECLLIRIKSAAVTVPFEVQTKIRVVQTKASGSDWGTTGKIKIFQKLGNLFHLEVCENLKGLTLLLDEIALSEAVKLNQRTMQLDRFVDLGSYKPEGALNIRADHALVFMFQPFQCNWVQVIGCFLSRSATVSDILHKLIIECVILLENAGYKVDAVTCDGAQWNRGTPDDYVYRRHWEALLAYECSFKANMSITYKLTSGHIKPEQYQNINVLLAVEFFSKRLRVAMQMYEDQCSELKSCKSTIQFMERVDRLITAMTSRTPENALRPDIFYDNTLALFADDTAVISNSGSYNILIDKMHADIINKFSHKWKIKLNANKTEMLITSHNSRVVSHITPTILKSKTVTVWSI
ncbi:hypothetical protein PV328_007733 [Microctonus aethiopoides]|uniref:Uncharacterized protein n=1 Tax=Microctonus aethiopoides TaxID=144406 RepID=A0AA39F0S1_9HYME|nr:hypothetical protein PV328_007733 [Microctonus aethiopoides]